MRITKTFKKEDGTRYQLSVSIATDFYAEPKFNIYLYKAEPRKRKFVSMFSDDSPEMRAIYYKLSSEDRFKEKLSLIKKEINPDWLTEIREELIRIMQEQFTKTFNL